MTQAKDSTRTARLTIFIITGHHKSKSHPDARHSPHPASCRVEATPAKPLACRSLSGNASRPCALHVVPSRDLRSPPLVQEHTAL
jgi:hypothetical protein